MKRDHCLLHDQLLARCESRNTAIFALAPASAGAFVAPATVLPAVLRENAAAVTLVDRVGHALVHGPHVGVRALKTAPRSPNHLVAFLCVPSPFRAIHTASSAITFPLPVRVEHVRPHPDAPRGATFRQRPFTRQAPTLIGEPRPGLGPLAYCRHSH